MSYKISIIVPVYNTEQYITKCLCSLLEQSFTDYEIIIVNDASPNNSIDTINSLLLKYPHRKEIVTIYTHKNNLGVAAARNTGLQHAKGEYLIQIDSDDYAELDMLEKMYAKAKENDADIIVADYLDTFEDRERYVCQKIPVSKEKCIEWLLLGLLHGSNSNKLVKRTLLINNSLQYIPNLNMYEDLIMSIKLFFYANKISYINSPFLHYVHYNAESYTKKLSIKSQDDIIQGVYIIETFLTESNSNTYQKALKSFKLRAKLKLLLNNKGDRQRKINLLYPDLRFGLWKHTIIPFHYRIALWFAYNKQLWMFNIIGQTINSIKFILK